MASWEPVDIDGDGTGDEDYEWGDDLMNDLERFNQLRQFNKTLDESGDETIMNMTTRVTGQKNPGQNPPEQIL